MSKLKYVINEFFFFLMHSVFCTGGELNPKSQNATASKLKYLVLLAVT